MSGVKETRRRSGALKHKRLSDLATDGQNIIKRVTAAANLRRRVKVHDAQSSERYPSEWLVTPGEPGFTAYATKVMSKAGVVGKGGVSEMRCAGPDDPQEDQPYQRTVAYLVHPKSVPNYRLLVAHRTGAGKTLIMIRVLSNFYDDPRPKLAIFPTKSVRDQFYREIMAFDNPYRDYAIRETGLDKKKAVSGQLTPDEMLLVKDALALSGPLLKKAGSSGYPAAPLRAYEYNEVGGAYFSGDKKPKWLEPSGGPCGATSKGKANVFCDKVIVMDEAHNLIKPDPLRFKLDVSRNNLLNARDALSRATRTVMVLLTATPMVDDVSDVDALLDVVKGHGNTHLSNEGFVSAFYGAPESAYPSVTPSERELPRVVRVELSGDPDDKSTSLGSYLDKMLGKDNKRTAGWSKSTVRDMYDYVATHPSFQTRGDFSKELRTSKAEVMAPKLWRAARLVDEAKGKVIVLAAKRHGFFVMASLLQNNPTWKHLKTTALLGSGITTNRADWKAVLAARGNAKDADVLKMFNDADNKDGSKLKALVLNADAYSEGVSFKDVRTVILLDVTSKWATVLQQVGRAVRYCSLNRLLKEERTVNTVLLVASLPPYVRRKTGAVVDLRSVLTADEENVINVLRDRAVIERKMCSLMQQAVDAPILGDGTIAAGCGPAPKQPEVQLGKADTAALLACHAKHGKCLAKAQRDFSGDAYHLETALALCTKERNACLENVAGVDGTQDYGDNCPPGYGFGQCVYHCRNELGLRGAELGRCIVRKNSRVELEAKRKSGSHAPLPSLRRKSGAASSSASRRRKSASPVCAACPEGMSDAECMVHCKQNGLKHGDLYRCVTRQPSASGCEHNVGAAPQIPSPAKAPPGQVLNPSTGKYIKRDECGATIASWCKAQEHLVAVVVCVHHGR